MSRSRGGSPSATNDAPMSRSSARSLGGRLGAEHAEPQRRGSRPLSAASFCSVAQLSSIGQRPSIGIHTSPYSTMWSEVEVGRRRTDDDRRVRLLHRLRPRPRRLEVHELAGERSPPPSVHSSLQARIFSRTILRRRRVALDAVVLHLLVVPAVADAEQEAPVRQLVERRDLLRQPDRVALRDERDAGAELERRVVTAAAAASARNWSCVRQYSSGSGGAFSMPPHGVRRDDGMCECSGNQSESKPRASASFASSMGWMPLSVGNIITPIFMASPYPSRRRRSADVSRASP